MAKDEDPDDLDLPDKDAAKGFYAKYEPKEILGRYGIGNKGQWSTALQEGFWGFSIDLGTVR